MNANSTGTSNSALGDTSGYDITTGTANTIIGYNTGRGITTGNYNTILGANVTGLSATIANNIIIADGQGNRRINVDSSGNVGINITSPLAKLHVTANGADATSVKMCGSGGSTNGNFLYSLATDWSDSFGLNVFATAHSANLARTNTLVRIHSNETASGGLPFRVTAQGSIASPTYEALAVNYLGNVGIGTTGPSTKLEVVGTITCTTLVETSSVVAKTNVKKLTSQTAKIAKLSPVSFNYKKDNKRSLGLIAEEVAQVYPELVEYDNGRPLGVNYSKLTAVLISTVNELAAEVAELKKQLNK
jgi:hypothetical protein